MRTAEVAIHPGGSPLRRNATPRFKLFGRLQLRVVQVPRRTAQAFKALEINIRRT